MLTSCNACKRLLKLWKTINQWHNSALHILPESYVEESSGGLTAYQGVRKLKQHRHFVDRLLLPKHHLVSEQWRESVQRDCHIHLIW